MQFPSRYGLTYNGSSSTVGCQGQAELARACPYLAFLTVILNDVLPVFALESVAEQLTTVRPIGNRPPERGVHVTGT